MSEFQPLMVVKIKTKELVLVVSPMLKPLKHFTNQGMTLVLSVKMIYLLNIKNIGEIL